MSLSLTLTLLVFLNALPFRLLPGTKNIFSPNYAPHQRMSLNQKSKALPSIHPVLSRKPNAYTAYAHTRLEAMLQEVRAQAGCVWHHHGWSLAITCVKKEIRFQKYTRKCHHHVGCLGWVHTRHYPLSKPLFVPARPASNGSTQKSGDDRWPQTQGPGLQTRQARH